MVGPRLEVSRGQFNLLINGAPPDTLFGGATIGGFLGGAGKLIDEREMTHLG